jgi:phosphate transport system permease protein
LSGSQKSQAGAFSGRSRARTPRKSVLIKDRVARWVISLGGIGSIVAVSLVGLFLFYVVIPLFLPSDLEEGGQLATGSTPAAVVHVGLNEYSTMVWMLHRDGSIYVRRLTDGRVIRRLEVPESRRLTCWSFSIDDDHCAFGYADGTVRVGSIGFATEFLRPAEVPDELQDLAVGEAASLREGIVERTPEMQFRYQELRLEMDPPQTLSTRPIVLVDQSMTNSGPRFAALDASGVLHVNELRKRRNLLTGEVTVRSTGGMLDLREAGILPDGGIQPQHLLLTGLGDNVMLAWPDGRLVRIHSVNPRQLELTGETDLAPEPGTRLTTVAFQIGKASLVTGDDQGRIRVWFRVKDPDGDHVDGTSLVLAHELPPHPSITTDLAPSARTRMVAAAFADGTAALYHISSDQRLVEVTVDDTGEPVEHLALGPRDDVLLSLVHGTGKVWRIEAPHPEVNWKSLMQRVWYEGYDDPAWVWQSSGATDAFEPKYSLMPLIFGTLKATFYSLLFGLPLAWFAAVYTSEFLHPRTKARIKPVIELMASLPSVVLGFLAALVFAPFLEGVVPETLTAFVTVPVCFLLGAYLWQLLPRETALRISALKFPLMFVGLPVGVALAMALGPGVEGAFFSGDMVAWLDGQVGTGTGGWMFLLLPLTAGVVFLFNLQVVDGWLRRSGPQVTRLRFGLLDLARFLVSCVAVLLLAWGASSLLAAAGLDPRGSYVDTYVQRNALVVGVVMGFAIIPIIYTISEDALSAVPGHLRAASLGAGATPWQTAIYVIIPPAISGLFSAMMIGLGRAVGETMIVLMAAGNTPVMEWNIFNGFRTLSANIAVELPEAVQNSTHYRTLFLAALTLFVMTFILNTAAEIVRLRFRKKSLEL